MSGGRAVIAWGTVADTRHPVWEWMNPGLETGKLHWLRAEHNRQGPGLRVPRISWETKHSMIWEVIHWVRVVTGTAVRKS